jgi:DNA-directed RNA polymerase specialized sigma24 family protein
MGHIMDQEHMSFETTSWTQILSARTEHSERRREALGVVSGQYWKPAYAYLRRKGYPHHEAEDLTQGFFADVVVRRDLVQNADREKGSFRSFLCTALVRYVSNTTRNQSAKKRMPEKGLISLEGMEGWQIPEAAEAMGQPDEAFMYAWASALLDDVLASVKTGCHQAGQDTHWEVFSRTVVEPALDGMAAPPLSEVCAYLSIDGEARASNMCITVKRRFRNALRASVRQFVDGESQVDSEIQDLIQILSKNSAGTFRFR